MNAIRRPAAPIRLYTFALSGHAHRAELFLSLLSLPFEKIEIKEHLATQPHLAGKGEALPGFVGMKRSPVTEPAKA